jgi:hypothetical protein
MHPVWPEWDHCKAFQTWPDVIKQFTVTNHNINNAAERIFSTGFLSQENHSNDDVSAICGSYSHIIEIAEKADFVEFWKKIAQCWRDLKEN